MNTQALLTHLQNHLSLDCWRFTCSVAMHREPPGLAVMSI